MPAKQKKQPRRAKGAARMKQLGQTAVVVWLDKIELDSIDRAAKAHGLKRARYLRTIAIDAAAIQNGELPLYRRLRG